MAWIPLVSLLTLCTACFLDCWFPKELYVTNRLPCFVMVVGVKVHGHRTRNADTSADGETAQSVSSNWLFTIVLTRLTSHRQVGLIELERVYTLLPYSNYYLQRDKGLPKGLSVQGVLILVSIEARTDRLKRIFWFSSFVSWLFPADAPIVNLCILWWKG